MGTLILSQDLRLKEDFAIVSRKSSSKLLYVFNRVWESYGREKVDPKCAVRKRMKNGETRQELHKYCQR